MMNKHGNFRFFLPLGFALALAGALFAQSVPNKILVVNGKSAGPVVRQIDGRSYVDIETLVEIFDAVVTIERHRVVLKIPIAPSDSDATASAAPADARPAGVRPSDARPADAPLIDAPPTDAPHADGGPDDALDDAPANAPPADARPPVQPPQGLSRDFASAAIANLAEMREWRGAIRAMITYGLAVSDTLAQDHQGRVMTGLRQAEVAATTEDDQRALQLLQNEADKLASWADSVFAARLVFNGAMTADPNALQNDPALAKIQSCGRFLNSMLVSGAFADDPSCH
jgi:hypothetical protein